MFGWGFGNNGWKIGIKVFYTKLNLISNQPAHHLSPPAAAFAAAAGRAAI